MNRSTDILDIIATRKSAGEPFALATVVRTVAATAAKAGAKAVILPDGTISEGWIGGGCARAAVLKAAQGRARRRPLAPRLGAAARPSRRPRRQRRRGARRRALRQEHVSEPGHHGHLHRAGAAAAAGRDLRLVAGCHRRRRSGAAHRLRRDGVRARGRAGGIRRGRPPHRRLCAAGRGAGRALRGGVDPRPRRRSRACARRSRSMPTTSPSSAAARRPRR